MCVVSAITPHMQVQWPEFRSPSWDQADLRKLQDILKKLDELDRKMGAKDCKEDAPKEAFMQELARRVTELERKLNP